MSAAAGVPSPPPVPVPVPVLVPLCRSVSAPGAADSGIEHVHTQPYFAAGVAQHAQWSEEDAARAQAQRDSSLSDAEAPPPPPPPPASGHAHQGAYLHPYVPEPHTPTASLSHHAATELLGAAAVSGSYSHSGLRERRNSRPNLRLQSHAPAKLSTPALSVPASASLLPPASPMTPMGGGAVPPNTPMSAAVQKRGHAGSQGEGTGMPVEPVYDAPFTPLPVPMSPMLPRPPPPSPFPQPARSPDSGQPRRTYNMGGHSPASAMSPLPSPAASPHPIMHVDRLPSIMSGIDALSPQQEGIGEEEEQGRPREESIIPPPPPRPADEHAAVAISLTTPQDELALELENMARQQLLMQVQEEEEEGEAVGEYDSMPSPLLLEVSVSHRTSGAETALRVHEEEEEEVSLLLHRSRLGRLTIVQRSELDTSAPPHGASASAAAAQPVAAAPANVSVSAPIVPPAVVSPTAVSHLSPQAAAKYSKKHGATVTSVARVQHVTFNPNDEAGAAQLSGVPEEWKAALKQQFGLPPNLQSSVKLDAYPSRIPTVLLRMADYLRSSRTLETQVGIFRLAPDQAECARLKNAINANVNAIQMAQEEAQRSARGAPHDDAPYSDLGACVANLLKFWFRDLPVALFQPIPVHVLSALTPASPPDTLERIISSHLKEPQQSIYRWLLDLCCDVTLHADTNKMTSTNLSICIGPNLYRGPLPAVPTGKAVTAKQLATDAAEAMKLIQLCKHYTSFLDYCIGMREVQRGQKKTGS